MGDCVLWTNGKIPNGYGAVWDPARQRNIGAHVAAYEAFVGPVPPGLCVCHTCDVRACVNPCHLFVGTKGDNARDMISKGRDRIVGERNGRAVLSNSDIAEVRALISLGFSGRWLAATFGVSPSCISSIKNGRTRRDS